MQYALGENATTAPADNLYTTSIPTGTNAGTYYVWYRVIGDENHNDSDPKCVTVTIREKETQPATQQTEAPQPQTEASQPQTEASAPTAEERITITKTPSKVKVKAKKNKVTVSWKKIKKYKAGRALLKKIKSIQVQYSTDKSFENAKTKSVKKTKTKVTLKLKKKTTYYVRVRYKGTDGFSKWSKVKKVRTKK